MIKAVSWLGILVLNCFRLYGMIVAVVDDGR